MSRFVRTAGLALLLAAAGGVLGHALADMSELEDTRWTLAALGATPAKEGVETTLVFLPGGQVNGRSGCNSYGGSLFGGVPGQIAATQRGCVEPGVMEQEMAFLTALDAAVSYTLDGDSLTLLDGAGGELATFSAAD